MQFSSWAAIALVSSASSLGFAQGCSSVLSVAEEAGLTTLLAGVESLEDSPDSGLFLLALSATFPFFSQYTIYAPSNAAFSAAFPGGIPAADTLGGILVNHVTEGAESSAGLAAQAAAAAPAAVAKSTVGTGSLSLTTDATGGLFIAIADSPAPPSRITTTDLETCAGVLHIINRVMLPASFLPAPPAPVAAPPPAAPVVTAAPALPPQVVPTPAPGNQPVAPDQLPATMVAAAPPPAAPAPVPPAQPPAAPAPTPSPAPAPAPPPAVTPIPASAPPATGPAPATEQCEPFADVVAGASLDRLQALITASTDYPPAAVVMAALSSTEPTTQQFTFFAPGNLAMRAALPGYTGPVKSVEVLSNHIVLGARDAATLLADIQEAGVGGLVLPTLGGSNLVLSSDGLTITILPEGAPPILAPAVVEEADLLACGGVMHIIDSVLEEGPGAVDGPLAGLSTPNVVEFPTVAPAAAPSSDGLAESGSSSVLGEQSECRRSASSALALACASAAALVTAFAS